MSGPSISIDLEKIENNSRVIVSLCKEQGIEVIGVTKVTCGMPQVARAMLRGGVSALGESRMENVHRLRANGINAPIVLLRIPPLSEVDEIVTSVDISLNSEYTVIEALSEAAERKNLVHEIILMVDLGDLREGIWPEDLIPMVRKIVQLKGVKIVGLGTNLTCYGGVIPTKDNIDALVAHAEELERRFDLKLRYISGGNSSSLPLLASGDMPARVNNLRIGEGLLLGRETVDREKIPGTVQDAFLLNAELIELKEKPSLPIGTTGEDAFGGRPVFEDRGNRMRGILNMGREDVDIDGITPVNSEISIFGASSDHLLVDVTDMKPGLKLGDRISFEMNYSALLTAMTSEYVAKCPTIDRKPVVNNSDICLMGEENLLSLLDSTDFIGGLKSIGYDTSEQKTEDPLISSLSPQVDDVLLKKQIPLILGQNHSTSMAGIEGLSKHLDSFGVICFAPEAKFIFSSDPENSEQGNLFDLIRSHTSTENVVLIGLKNASMEERELLKKSRAKIFTMEDVDNLGIKEVMRRALRAAGAGTKGIYVSFCPEVTEMRNHDDQGGLTYRETHQAMEMIAQSGLTTAMDIVGLKSDQEERLTQKICEFSLSCFGKRILETSRAGI